MSSNLKIKKICEHCNEIFIAQKTTTKFCSLTCARRNYKLREKKEKIKKSDTITRETLLQSSLGTRPMQEVVQQPQVPSELIDIKTLSTLTSISERTLFRLIKEKDFPKLKVGRSLLFHKQTVINHLVTKYGNI